MIIMTAAVASLFKEQHPEEYEKHKEQIFVIQSIEDYTPVLSKELPDFSMNMRADVYSDLPHQPLKHLRPIKKGRVR